MSDAGRPGRARLQDLVVDLRGRVAPDRPRAGLALVAAALAALFFALARYPIAYGDVRAPLDIVPGLPAQALSILAPLPAALTAAACVVEPWVGILAILLLTPWFDAAQVGWWAGPVQVLGLTVFVLALGAGVALTCRHPDRRASLRQRLAGHRLAFGGGLALLALATASTVRSPDIGASGPVWLHGVVEPLTLGLLALLLVPDRRALRWAILALGLSAALAGLIDLVQTAPTVPSLLALQDHDRTIFARLTYFNVGLFGEVLAMAIPLLAAAWLWAGGFGRGRDRLGSLSRGAARRSMAWSGPIREDSALRGPDRPGAATLSVISIALLVTLACLYLTFSKSAWLATGVALCLLALACLHGWRSRLVAVFLAVVASAVVAPWPLVVLRPMAPPVAGGYEALMTRIWGADRLASWDPTTAGGEVSITERLYASGAALQMAADHPLLGVGLDRFKSEYAGAYRDPRAKVVLDSAHDLLPNLAAESGLPFALLVAAAMAAGLAAAWRVWRATDDADLRLLAAGLGTALVAWWIVSATFDPDLYRIWRLMASDIVFAAVLVGLALALPGLADARSAPPSPLRRGDLRSGTVRRT